MMDYFLIAFFILWAVSVILFAWSINESRKATQALRDSLDNPPIIMDHMNERYKIMRQPYEQPNYSEPCLHEGARPNQTIGLACPCPKCSPRCSI